VGIFVHCVPVFSCVQQNDSAHEGGARRDAMFRKDGRLSDDLSQGLTLRSHFFVEPAQAGFAV
jgi:hypothetical protein